MTTRVHTADVESLGVYGADDDEIMETFGEGWTAADVHLVIEDGGNQEAWIIEGEPAALQDFCLRAYDGLCEQRWDNNYVQFARLLAEIHATGTFDMKALCTSMDLGSSRIIELFDRAEAVFERIKEGIV